jgi:hypothetical protein
MHSPAEKLTDSLNGWKIVDDAGGDQHASAPEAIPSIGSDGKALAVSVDLAHQGANPCDGVITFKLVACVSQQLRRRDAVP